MALKDYLDKTGLSHLINSITSKLDSKVEKVSGKGLSTNDYTTNEKNKLSGIARGAEVNQNAFSNIVVGSTTISADSKTDTLTLTAGSNVTLTPDATNDKVTITATVPTKTSQLTNDSGFKTTDNNTTYSLSKSGSTITLKGSDGSTTSVTDSDTNTTYSVATQSANGLMSSGDKTKLDTIATNAEVNQNAFSKVVIGSTTIEADSKTDTLTLSAGSNVTLMPNATNDTVTIAAKDTTYGVATSSALGLVKSGTDITVDSSGNVSVNDDSHNHIISNVDGLQSSLDSKLSKTTYEYNKELILGSSGKVCIGVFPCYDSNISVEIKSTTNTTYHGTLIIATQNINTSQGGAYTATVYGDENNTLTSSIKIQYLSGSNAFSIYINLPSWSKNILHIQCVSLAGTPTNIATTVDSIPSTATIVPTNAFSHTHNYAGSSSAGGSATSAVKLDTSAGSATQPVYFSGGKPVACTYTIGKSVPSNAVFTDTTYSTATTSANGLMSSSDKTKLDSIATGANKTTVDSALSSSSTNPVQNKVVNSAISNLKTLVGSTSVSSQIDSAIDALNLSTTYIPASKKGAANGVAELDSAGKVPSSQLPSYVDDVLEYSGKSNFPSTGETGKIYVDTSTNLTYRWSGSAYVEISPSLALGTTSSTAFRGDYGNTAYTHAQAKGSAFSSGLYKITTNAQGHVTAATAVAKSDITGLGIPAQDTTYSAAGSSLGLVKTGGDVTISSGVITVNDDSHNHTIANVDNLQSTLDSKMNNGTELTGSNLNSVTSVGFYYSGGSNTCTNKPSGVDAFGMEVFKTASGYVTQILTEGNTVAGARYIRQYNANSWSSWLPLTGFSATPTSGQVVIADGANGKVKTSGYTIASSVPSGAKFTDTTYSAATTSAAGLMSKDDKAKLDGITASADSVSFSRSLTSGTKVGTITINGTGTDLYAPTNTDTHHTAKNIVGSSSTATSNVTAVTSNPYLNLIENGSVRSTHRISGSGATSVSTDTSGNITISSTNTTYSAGTGLSLSGTTFSNSGVRSVATGSTNGTISVNTGGTSAEVAVKGLGSAAYTDSSSYATSNHTHNYLPLAGGAMTGSIITPKNDNMGIIPDTNNYGQIGSSDKKFYRMYATTFYGALSGNASTASSAAKLTTARTIALSGDVTGSASFDGSADSTISATLASSGVTAGSYGQSANASPAHSGTFSVPYFTVDAKGRVTAASTKTITLPSDNNTHYKAVPHAGSSSSTSATATTNGNTYINIVENGSRSGGINIKGSGATSVTSDSNGVITVSSTNTTYSIGTASKAGLTKLYTSTGSGTDGTMTQNAITNAINAKGLPTVSSSDNGKFLRVVNGAWSAATIPSAENASF